MPYREQFSNWKGDEWIVDAGGECLLRDPRNHHPNHEDLARGTHGLWEWEPEMELGIPVLDRQHRQFTLLVEELRQAEKRRDHNAQGAVMAQLDELMASHFAIEERLMEIARFPLLHQHQESHRAIEARLTGYREQLQAGREVGKALLGDLKIFLGNHMQTEDRRYVPYLLGVAKRGWLPRFLHALFLSRGMA